MESMLLTIRTQTSFGRPSRGSRIAVALLCLLGACDNPARQHDHYVVEGTLDGNTCRLTLDGRPIVGDTAVMGVNIFISRDDAANVGLKPGQGLKSVTCRGLQILIASPVGTFPPVGRYRVVSDSLNYPEGTAAAILVGSGVGTGRWLLAPNGTYLEAGDGFVQLDTMTDSSARGTFRIVARRRSHGIG